MVMVWEFSGCIEQTVRVTLKMRNEKTTERGLNHKHFNAYYIILAYILTYAEAVFNKKHNIHYSVLWQTYNI